MRLKISAGLFLLLLCCGRAAAQGLNVQSDTISWSINGMTDLKANATVPYQCKFLTFGTNNIDWVQDNGNFVLHFSVTSATGDWSNPAENGSITLTINGEGLNGQFVISKTTSGLSASLYLTGGTTGIDYTYLVQSYENN